MRASPRLNLKLERAKIIEELIRDYELKQRIQYHYPTVYQAIYNRLTTACEQLSKQQPPTLTLSQF